MSRVSKNDSVGQAQVMAKVEVSLPLSSKLLLGHNVIWEESNNDIKYVYCKQF